MLFCLGVLWLAGKAEAGTLVVYSAQDKRVTAALIAKFQQVHPDVEVKVHQLSSADLQQRLIREFEVSEPGADVIIMPEQIFLDRLKTDQRLMQVPVDTSRLVKGSYDREGFYYATHFQNVGIAYLKDAKFIPRSWYQLTNKAMEGTLVLLSPDQQENHYIYSMLMHSPKLLEDFIRELAKVKHKTVQSLREVMNMLGTEGNTYAIALDSSVIRLRNEGIFNIQFVYPREGAIPLFNGVGVFKTTKNSTDSQRLVKFLLSEAAQNNIVNMNMALLSVRSDIPTPLGYPSKINYMVQRLSESLSQDERVPLLFKEAMS